MKQVVAVFLLALLCSVLCKPVENENNEILPSSTHDHVLTKRFINPMFTLGSSGASGVSKIRAKRSDEECEKLSLCKLHARSSRNFLSAFELYFVNKENARLWDHRQQSLADCEARFGDCYDDK